MKTTIKLFSIVMLLMVGFIFLFYCPCQADWKKTTISKKAGSSSIALDPSGHPHISYLDESNPSNYVLKHAYFDGHTWHKETVDSGNVGWWTSIAIDSLGHIHISYHADYSQSNPEFYNYSLKYAYFNGVSWNITTIDKGGYSTSIAVDNNNYPHISHITASAEMEYIRYDGVNWLTETIAEGALWFGSTSLALTSSGKAYISFSDSSSTRKQYVASNVSGAWEVHYISDGRSSSLALDSFGNPHIVYYSEGTQELKYSYYDGSVWVTEATSLLADSPHIALDSFNHPHISFGTNVGVECLSYTYFDGQDWIVQVLDKNNAGFDTSIALDQKGLPHISYQGVISEENSVLNYVHFSEPDLTGQWTSFNNTCKSTKNGIKCTIKGKLTIQNTGDQDAPSSKVRFYLSDDTTYNGEDTFLKQIATGKIKAGKSNIKTFTYSFPYGVTATGKYIIAVIDADNTVVETDENNNNLVYGPIP